ncbi:acyl-coenzyme A diphosphatase NUDT19-like isoform X2 [Babylonia areolata]
MCQKLEVVPDVWSLHEWSNWLTPCGLKQRFDTAFFICCLQDKPNVAEDEWETVHSQWGSPYDILQEYYQGGVALAPPQIYELGRLMNFSTVPDLLKFACQRGQHRVERWLPVKVASSDSLMSVFPGDSLYPKDIDPEGPDVTFTHTERLAELDNSHPNKHRALVNPEMRHADGRMCYRVVCNIALPGEHVAPHIPDSEFKFVPRL